MEGKIVSCNIDGARFFKENLPYRSLEDRQHHSGTPGPIIGLSFLTHWFSTAQHTRSCRLTVALHLKIPSSGQTIKPGIDHRTYKEQTTRQIPFDNPDRSDSCKQHSLYRVSTLLRSQNVIKTGFMDTNLIRETPLWLLWRIVKVCNTVSSLSLQVDVRVLPVGSLFKFSTFPPVSNLSPHPTVVICFCVCARNSFLQLHCSSTTISLSVCT